MFSKDVYMECIPRGYSLESNKCGFTVYREDGEFTVAPRSGGEANDRVVALQNYAHR